MADRNPQLALNQVMEELKNLTGKVESEWYDGIGASELADVLGDVLDTLKVLVGERL